jgi:hypothetical protein
VSGDAAVSATDARRTKRLLLPVWLVAERHQARTADSEREVAHTTGLSFLSQWVLMLVRQMRRRKVGLAARRHAVTARVAAL